MTDEDNWHIIPICIRARGGPNGFPTRLHATEGLKLVFNQVLREEGDYNAGYYFPEWWFPNDPTSNQDGLPRDDWHLEWAQGPPPEDLGNGIMRRE